MTTSLTWWEAEEILSHLSSRPDLWYVSDDNEHLWLRSDDESLLCGILIVPPADSVSPFRMSHVQAVSYEWDEVYTDEYVTWLISNWTTRMQRITIEEFLRNDLKIDAETAAVAAIAIQSFEWDMPKADEPAAPPKQEEFWPRDAPPRLLVEDKTHVGTYLLSGGTGWIRLRLAGGMLKAQLSVRAKDGQVLALDGFVRPFTSDARSAAAKLAGWEETPPYVTPDLPDAWQDPIEDLMNRIENGE